MATVARLAAALLFASLAATDLSAQGKRSKFSTELSTVKDLHIETGPLGAPAKSCGLTATDLETPARVALEASRLRVIDTASDFVFVNANVIAIGDSCTAAVDVELFRFASDFGASVSVWRHTAMISGSKNGFNARVREKVDSLTKEFTAEWQKARR